MLVVKTSVFVAVSVVTDYVYVCVSVSVRVSACVCVCERERERERGIDNAEHSPSSALQPAPQRLDSLLSP